LRPVFAVALFAAIVIGLLLTLTLADRFALYSYTPLDKSPEVLTERAREIIGRFGYDSSATDEISGLDHDRAPLEYLAKTDKRVNRWDALKSGQPAAVFFWYRASPNFLETSLPVRSWSDPPAIDAGMTGLKLDMR